MSEPPKLQASALCRGLALLLLGPTQLLGQAAALAAPVQQSGLAAAVEAATAQLRRTWAADPSTATLPFPQVLLLPPGVDANGTCSPGARAKDPTPAALYCNARNQVLLEHDLISNAYAFNRASAVAYWIAIALAERLQARGGKLAAATSSLQANCLAGVLLAAAPDGPPANQANGVVKAAGKAYGDLVSTSVGTPEQRVYAVLSGYGGTPSGCSADEMGDVAKGLVPDAAKLRSLGQAIRANSNLKAAYSSQCQSLPNKPCPRPIASSLNPPRSTRR